MASGSPTTSARNGHSTSAVNLRTAVARKKLLLTDEQIIAARPIGRATANTLLYSRAGGQLRKIWALPLEGERKPLLVVPRAANSFSVMGRLSPDGRWLAYSSSESGTYEVYVVPFGGGQGKWQVSANGGRIPQWSRDGKELYYYGHKLQSLARAGEGCGGRPAIRRRSDSWSPAGPPRRSSTTSRPTARKFFSTGFRSRSASPSLWLRTSRRG